MKILVLLTSYATLLQSTSPSLTLYSSATTSMIPQLSNERFVKRCHVRVLRASPNVSRSSFVKISIPPGILVILLDLLPLRMHKVSQSTSLPADRAETERDATNKEVELQKRNETMSDVYRALAVPSLACLCRSSFPPTETRNKRLPRCSPCCRSHLDQRSRCDTATHNTCQQHIVVLLTSEWPFPVLCCSLFIIIIILYSILSFVSRTSATSTTFGNKSLV